MSYAGPQALKDMFGCGHYGTVKAHSDRWQAFVRWCRSEDGPGFNDARQIDRQTLLDYARSDEHTSELQSLMRISYAVFCLKTKTQTTAPIRCETVSSYI